MARRKVGLSRAQINQSRAVFQSLSQKQFVSQVKEERKKRGVTQLLYFLFIMQQTGAVCTEAGSRAGRCSEAVCCRIQLQSHLTACIPVCPPVLL